MQIWSGSERRSIGPSRPTTIAAAEHEQRGRDDRAGDRAANDVRQAAADREERDDQLGRVAEARVQEAADAGARVLGDVLGRLTDQERERHERRRGEHEAGRAADAEREMGDERDRGERERDPEEHSRHRSRLTVGR